MWGVGGGGVAEAGDKTQGGVGSNGGWCEGAGWSGAEHAEPYSSKSAEHDSDCEADAKIHCPVGGGADWSQAMHLHRLSSDQYGVTRRWRQIHCRSCRGESSSNSHNRTDSCASDPVHTCQIYCSWIQKGGIREPGTSRNALFGVWSPLWYPLCRPHNYQIPHLKSSCRAATCPPTPVARPGCFGAGEGTGRVCR